MEIPTTLNPILLLVDDEEALIRFLVPLLERSGFCVFTAKNGKEALALAEKNKPDLIVADVVMPEMNGRDLLRVLRKQNCYIPMILLTKVGESFEKAIALDEGADDYLNKPFDPVELIARIRAVLRRSNPNAPTLASSWVLKADSLLLDRRKNVVTLNGEKIHLTPKAYVLLEFLMTHPCEVLSRKRLLNAVWDWDFDSETRVLSNRIAELRHALKEEIGNPIYIETVSGQGYRFLKNVESQL